MIEVPYVIKKILKHSGLWDAKRKTRPVDNVYPPLAHYSAEAYFKKS